MDPSSSKERAQQLQRLFDAVVELDPDARATYLDQHCSDDAIRREVEALLAAYDERATGVRHALEFLAPPPAADGPGKSVAPNTDPLVGQTLSHYQILEKLGGGGMGVVYKARDTTLDRTVALKFLPPDLTRDPEARQRFVREAKAASALDHANICTIYEIGETEQGQTFIAMAYYGGETLKKKIAQGPLPLDEALDYAAQVAQGLVKAHAGGIVHRDVKPANVMVTEEGVVKLVDFGLAKVSGQTQLTQTGTTLGTVAYMSPEQAQGQAVDARTDIWSLGVVLYEMVAGQLPFKGAYHQAVLYGVLHEDPEPLTALRTGVPMALERVVEKALAKRPEARYQHVDEVLVDLRSLRRDDESATPSGREVAAPSSGLRRALRYGSVAALAFVLVSIGALLWQQASTQGWFSKTPEEPMTTVQLTSFPGSETSPTFSPDGSQIAFA